MISFYDQLIWVKKHVDDILSLQFEKKYPKKTKLISAIKYSLLFGGKRFRPFLAYAIGSILNISEKVLDVLAISVECIHTYSLIHDDLPAMDNDILRRGKKTCHVVFGEAHAILAGDALHNLAFELLSSTYMPGINDKMKLLFIRELSSAIGINGMCLGQALDIELENNTIDKKMLKFIHLNKTGALIRATIRMTAFAGGYLGKKILPLLDKYADIIGLLFQIHDDVLDTIGDIKKIGKTTKIDQRNKKNTYVSLLGLKKTQNIIFFLHKKALFILNKIEKKYDINVMILKDLTNFIIQRDH
ncbi:MAG: (2E,6E)-farnesyl diphosphate synthase [Arsenophonus sp.]|nr:MAG: (2E,6E)-farnesyl diphosphate synthase [Arsenophonus sp.]